MTEMLFPVPAWPTARVRGVDATYPVTRIFCVGRNYAEHAKAMGVEVDREAPFYFLTSNSALVPSGAAVAYPSGTENYHYEMEFVVAIGAPAFKISEAEADSVVYGYATGLDMTRRDLQLQARAKQRPWDLGKDFEQSAVLSEIIRKEEFGAIGEQRIWLDVNDAVKQDSKLSELVWSVPELVSHLSHFYHLVPGDLIYTGTPAGVGAVVAGDKITGCIDGLPSVELTVGAAE